MSREGKENIFSVSEVTRHIKNVLETNIPHLFVEGEIANFTQHGSGHIYFSLKDEYSSLRCVFFKSYNLYLGFTPADGNKVICTGKITVFEKSGNYQLNVIRMYPAGIGELQLRFEELKRKLDQEGLFAADHKLALPRYPEKIGVITSETGATIQDIRNVILRRFPCQIYLYPAIVQGDAAPAELIAGLEFFNTRKKVDVIILGRGGGSQEDLFCFNDEKLARAIYNSRVPVISAVGHEIDFTIADFVADLRAPTPSAAAELAVPDGKEVNRYLTSLQDKIISRLQTSISERKWELRDLESQLLMFHPINRIRSYQQELDETGLRMGYLVHRALDISHHKLELLASQLQELSPREALKRGYSILRQNKSVITSVKKAVRTSPLEVILHDGTMACEIKKISRKKGRRGIEKD
ncbi:MAG: exodeoxyribonuclease VII large subunit [Candidatus Cloacimonetes bacterium]|nr:exodeoxyribonuclease VII large subunit [Candidatus Cloacimonadota bacterium]